MCDQNTITAILKKVDYLICELSCSWKSNTGYAKDYYNKIYEGKDSFISEYELIYENKYKYLTENGIRMLKDKSDFIALDDHVNMKKMFGVNYESMIPEISDCVVDYINYVLSYDSNNQVYYLDEAPVGVMSHSLPVYVNLNKDYLKEYNSSLFK